MDEAFEKYAGFKLSTCTKPEQLAKKAKELEIEEIESNPFSTWPWDDLYELILVQCVEPNLPKTKPVFLMNYPAKVPCLSKDCPELGNDKKPLWKERCMANLDLSKYGISNNIPVVHNPSYEELFQAEMNPANQGFDKVDRQSRV